MVAEAPAGSRAEKTRQAILSAAERLFAERGFSATRLEDIAEQVGIRRASMVYHFKDKRELHAAVITNVLGGLSDEIQGAIEAGLDPIARIEAAVGAWVDYLGSRPATARILLRGLANAGRELPKEWREAASPLWRLVLKEFVNDPSVRDAVRGAGEARIDPLHVASTIAGATLFFVAATPMLSPHEQFDPLDPAHIATHKEELLSILRRLLRLDGS